MKTTLNPPPTESEKRMIWEFALTMYPSSDQDRSWCFVQAEAILEVFRDKYGVTGAEVEAIGPMIDLSELNPNEREPMVYAEMQAEIARLREALEAITQPNPLKGSNIGIAMDTAREALKGGPHETR